MRKRGATSFLFGKMSSKPERQLNILAGIEANFPGAGAPRTPTCADSALRICFVKLFIVNRFTKERTCAWSRKRKPIEVQAGPDRAPLVKATLRARIARP